MGKVTASMDRYELDVCPSWPSAALARELRMTAALVFIADDQSPETLSQELHHPETTVERAAEVPEELHPPETQVEQPAEQPELHPPETSIEQSVGHAEDAEQMLEVAPQASALESHVAAVTATVECYANVDPSPAKPQQGLEQERQQE